MCNVFRVRFVSAVFFLLLSIQAAMAAGIERGLLWQIESPQGGRSYLFGTIHTDDARVTNFSPKIVNALASADAFMLEALPPRDSSVLLMPAGTLRDLLRPEEVEEVLRQADARSMQGGIVLRMKPWLLALVIAQPYPASPFSQDMQLFAIAGAKGKEVVALESADGHFGALDSLGMPEQIVLLRGVLSLSQDEKEQAYKTLVQVYMSGDTERIAALDEELSSKGLPPALWEKMRKILIDQRNANMVAVILERIGKETAFVAVGAAHLPGDDGLVARLRKAGYKLNAIE